MTLLTHTPAFSADEARLLLSQHFAIEAVECKRLVSDRDQNFYMLSRDDRQFVLKISNALETREVLEGQNALLKYLAGHDNTTPEIVLSERGEPIVSTHHDRNDHLARLVTFVPGIPMSDCRYSSPRLLGSLGENVARLDVALAGFEHDSFHRHFNWDLAHAPSVIRERMHLIGDPTSKKSIELLLQRFCKHTVPVLEKLPKSIIHNDVNDGNVVVARRRSDECHSHEIAGIIDFGDAVFTWTVADLAIAIAYAILDQPDPLEAARNVVQGYHSIRKLSDDEIASLFGLVCMRLCTSAAMAAEQSLAQPENEYLVISQDSIRTILPQLTAISFEFAEAWFRRATGLPACSSRESTTTWLKANQSRFSFPVNPNNAGVRPATSSTLVLNLGVDSPLLPADIDTIREPELTQIIFDAVAEHHAAIAIGQYLEPRLLYSSGHFTGDDISQENRTVHLGVDLFAKAGTPVIAPLKGTVWYTGSIDKPLDYGGLVVLQHRTDHDDTFYTLYGHLDPSSTDSLCVGATVDGGTEFAQLGDPGMNGGWTPHLHFQLMLDLLGRGHEFPGVGRASEVEVWSEISPDPNLILGIPSSCFPDRQPDKMQTLQSRNERLGTGLSVSYADPLKIVRGWKQHLFDETGRRFLDAFNNVPHVGHSHPRVVESIYRQLSLLNTNTRYLSDNVNELAMRLASTMPKGLDVCYFVNSASEANELALRLARQHTSAKDMLVLEDAYHGHTTSLIELSPYKHNGPGGAGAPDWVHTVPVADSYRGKFRDPATAGQQYAADVEMAISGLQRKLCGFICESCPSVGGQIIFPDGYLPAVYDSVHQAGGVCIADDVQTGYGRLGSVMYGFELQHVIPDIVILGKPIGNGHPLAAVVTTREIADSFDNGMEFFSTFGGNSVSCAAGLAVLNVVEEERLQENAYQVGNQLLTGLRELQNDFPVMGDVRGSGFFLGIEMVKDPETRDPAVLEASFVCNQMRECGVLIGTDGPFHNVLKIRPPMCFDEVNAVQLLTQLKKCLGRI